VTIKQAIDEVQIAWSAAACAYRELSRQMRFGAGGEGGYLLVPDVKPLDLASPGIASVSPLRLSPTMP
jgi:hypothetical protein